MQWKYLKILSPYKNTFTRHVSEERSLLSSGSKGLVTSKKAEVRMNNTKKETRIIKNKK